MNLTHKWTIGTFILRLKFCFEANNIILDSVKRANFFTVCGSRVYETLLALITPRKASDVTFQEIEKLFNKPLQSKAKRNISVL